MIRRLPIVALAAALSLSLASCSSSTTATSNAPDAGVSEKAQQALDKIKGQVLSKGPNGETPSPASVADLTPEEIEKVKGLNAKAAIVMHYGGNDWATAQVN